MTEAPVTWREAIEADPLGLAGRRPGPAPAVPAPQASPRRDLLRLVAGVAAMVGIGFASGHGETVLLLLVLILCIVAHEFGHYLAAKTGGIKVTEFFVGFGPRLWSVRRGETEYGVKAIPLGGYCRIIGMNDLEEGVDPAEEHRTYRAAGMWRRLLIDVAGSSMHFVIALVLLFAMFFWTGDQARYLAPPLPDANVAVGAVSAAAADEGFRLGDRIETIDGRTFPSWSAQANYIHAHGGKPIHVVVDRNGHPVDLVAVPKPQPGSDQPIIGLNPAIPVIHSSLGGSVAHSFGAFGAVASGTFAALGHLVTFSGIDNYFNMISSQKAAANNPGRLTTVIGLPSVLQQAAQAGPPAVLWILALINISIGLINLLPLFPLDGGRVVIALYEGMRGLRRPRYRVATARVLPIMYAGLAVIAFFALGSMFIDLRSVGS